VTIVLAYVPTAQGQAALSAAVTECRLRGEDLVAINGTTGESYVDPRFAQPAQISAVEAELDASGVTYSWRQEVGDDPVEAVLDVIKEVKASLLVIGLRRRSPAGKLFMGSRAQELLLHAPCPVLAVKVDG
jgi:nucleotide-binding universal stress UspA family protein